jgi:meso-butanediol dehydrogenase/(S,S)-butanediol dehydrogenase/diacetyl reductase
VSTQRVALVTGGSSGIGRATAVALLDAGYDVLICARDEARLAATADEIGSDRLAWQACDAGDHGQARAAVQATLDRFGRLDTVISSHGVIGSFASIEELTPEGWEEVLRANLLGPINVTQAAIAPLRASRGSVVLIASVNAHQAEPLMAPYGVSKGGLVNFTMYAARELAADGIRVNCIAPGWVLTPMAQPFFEEAGAVGKPVDFNMLQRPGQPEEIARVAVFLAGEGASFMTGETVVVDGGMITQMAPLRVADGAS